MVPVGPGPKRPPVGTVRAASPLRVAERAELVTTPPNNSSSDWPSPDWGPAYPASAGSQAGPGEPPPPPGGGYPGGDYPGGGYPGGGYPPPGYGPPGGGYPPPGYGPPGGGYPGGGYPGGGDGGYPGWGPGTGGPNSGYGQLAGWWSRVGATIIDGIILGIPSLILILATSGSLGARAGVEVIIVVGEAIYFTLMLSQQGRTVGNMAVSTRVVDARTGGPLSTGKAFGRWASEMLFGVLSFAFFIPTLLDYLWPLWDKQNQTLHDKMAGTVVIYTR